MAVTSSKTVAQARALAQAYLNEPGTTSISTAQWLLFANQAQFEVFREIITVNPDQYTARTTITWPANTGAISLTGASYLNDDVYRITGVERFDTLTPVDGTDLSIRLKPCRFQDISDKCRLGAPPGWYAITGHTTQLKLYLAPVPTAATLLYVSYVEAVPELTSDSSTLSVPLEYQDAVCRRMASLANIRGGGRNQAVEAAWRDSLADIAATAGPRIADEPRQVREILDPDGYGYGY